jgi:glutamate-1-semialdehyde 2,1-aminomutase
VACRRVVTPGELQERRGRSAAHGRSNPAGYLVEGGEAAARTVTTVAMAHHLLTFGRRGRGPSKASITRDRVQQCIGLRGARSSRQDGRMPTHGLDAKRIRALLEREHARFIEARPRSTAMLERARGSMPNGVPMAWFASAYAHPAIFVESGRGARFTDVDGHTYSDFNVADMSMFGGYGAEAVTSAVAERMALGNQFLLPTEDVAWVAEELARRFGPPKWQFTLSASQANVEAIRVSRVRTQRDVVLMFEGRYHGHFDEGLMELRDGRLVPEEPGVPHDVAEYTRVVPFNDPDALRAALEPRDVALVLAEPVMTNNHGLLLPRPGFHDALREITRDAGTLLCLDETHTQVCGPGGLTRLWDLQPDLISTGKSVAAGVPLGAYGMTDDVAAVLEQEPERGGTNHGTVATGGTLFGNALSMAAARATLDHVLTPNAYDHAATLGARLSDGLQQAIAAVGLDWYVHRLRPRSGVVFAPEAPADARAAASAEDADLTNLARAWLANRGVWEAIPGAGPTVPVPATEDDVDRYVDAYGALLQALTAP